MEFRKIDPRLQDHTACLYVSLSVCLYDCLSVCLSILTQVFLHHFNVSVFISTTLFQLSTPSIYCMPLCVTIYFTFCVQLLHIHASVCVSVCNLTHYLLLFIIYICISAWIIFLFSPVDPNSFFRMFTFLIISLTVSLCTLSYVCLSLPASQSNFLSVYLFAQLNTSIFSLYAPTCTGLVFTCLTFCFNFYLYPHMWSVHIYLGMYIRYMCTYVCANLLPTRATRWECEKIAQNVAQFIFWNN
jgi:hypothetical protein